MKTRKPGSAARVLSVLLSIILIIGLMPLTALADSPAPINILITSDVHDRTDDLRTFITNIQSQTSAIDHMIFGGDFTYNADPATVASTCTTIATTVYPGVPVVKAKGNHDTTGTYDKGLVYNGSDYAIYVLDLDPSSQTISMDKINALDTALSGIDSTKPVFVVSHYPLHYYTSRTTANASALVEKLNNYPNVVFLWGHNHTLDDPGYGTVKKDGDTIQCASNLSPVTIHFTYANMGSIYHAVNNATGMLLTLTKTGGDTILNFQYKSLNGTDAAAYAVTLDTTNLAEKPAINSQPQDVTVDIGADASLSVDATVNDNGVLSYQWYQDDNNDCTGGTEVGTNSPDFTAPTQTTGTKYYYCRITNSKDGDTAAVTSEAARVRVTSGDAGSVTFEYASSIVSGGKYVIVCQTAGGAYALTTSPITVSDTDFLVCTPVTVNGGTINADDVNDTMIWDMTADGEGYNAKNGGSFLHRKSGTSGGIYLNSADAGASYTDWKYNSTTHNLNVYSSGQDEDFFLYRTSSGDTNYLACSTTESNSIYLYRVTVSNPMTVNNVDITGVDEPVAGAMPDTSAVTATVGVLSPPAVSWSPAGSPFGYDTAYTASLTITPQFAYEFTSQTAVTINGIPADTVELNSSGTLTATYTFDKTAGAPLYAYEYATSIESGCTYVVVDKGTPNYALVASVANTNYLAAGEVSVNGTSLNPAEISNSMLWTFTTDGSGYNVKNGSNFLTRPSGGTDKITLKTSDDGAANTDWQYDSTNHVIKIKGSSSSYYLYQTSNSNGNYFLVASSDTNAKTMYLYKQTVVPPTQIASVAVTGIDAPAAGNTPDTTASIDTAFASVSAVTWQPNVTAFGYHTDYTAQVKLTPQSGYAFANDATVTINGQTAQVTRNANGSLTASYTFEALDTTSIGSVTVTDIEAPAAGGTPDTTATVPAHMTVSDVTWTPADNPFGYHTAYAASVTLTAEAGYAFASDAAVTIDGNTADITQNTGATLTASFAFDATADEPINSVAVTDIEAPTAGGTPDTTATAPAHMTPSGVTWTPADNPFGFGTVYTASVTLTADPGYVFASDAAATIDGFTATITENTGGTLTACYAFPSTAAEPISSVAVTDIEAPASGHTPDTTATVPAHITVSDVTWTPADNPFSDQKAYTVIVTLTADTGFVFTDSVAVTIDGHPAHITNFTGGTLTAGYKFDATADEPITSVAVTDIETPAAGGTPDTTAAVPANMTVSDVTWAPADNPFGYHTAYTASVTLTADTGYVFASDAAVTIDGFTATITENTGGTLTACYAFPATAAEPITSVAVTDIEAPTAGGSPDTTASAPAHITSSDVTWAPADNPFGFGTVYTASVTLTADTGYVFASDAAVTVDGNTATITENTGGTLTASLSFDATAAAIDAETPNISGQPQNVTATESGSANLSVTASVSQGSLSYQWYKNTADNTADGTLISGATAQGYSAPTDTIGTMYYYCVVTNTDPKATGAQTATAKTQTCKVTVQVQQYVITALPNNSSYGTASGGGRFDKGTSVTLTATPKSGYGFVCWKKSGAEVSRSAVYTFTATSSGSYTAQFAAVTPVGISCTIKNVTIYRGSNGSVTITASGGNSGAYEYSLNGDTSWQSSGQFSGLSAGTYTAAVRDASNPNNKATSSITVGQPTHLGNVPAKKLPSKANAGTALTIVPPAAPKGYTVVSTTYSSSNPSVATVDSGGNLTFVAGGKAVITTKVVCQSADGKGKTKIITIKKTVTVKQLVSSLSLNTAAATISKTQKVKLTVSVDPSTATNKKVKWTSSNPKVASVSGTGVVTGKAGGTAVITCTAKDGSGAKATCTITVTPINPTGIKLSKTTLPLKTGKSAALKATVLPKNTDYKTVTWTSSNKAVATVDAKGRIKAIAPGTAVITAATSNGLTASCTVTVK